MMIIIIKLLLIYNIFYCFINCGGRGGRGGGKNLNPIEMG
jgi:hypothetical protein